MKATIILSQSLSKQIDALARERQTSRNRVIVVAMQDYLRCEQTRRLRDQLDQVYGEPLDPDEEEL